MKYHSFTAICKIYLELDWSVWGIVGNSNSSTNTYKMAWIKKHCRDAQEGAGEKHRLRSHNVVIDGANILFFTVYKFHIE